MKPCEQVLLYKKGELNAQGKAAFEAHLKACPACQNELKFLAKLDEGLIPPAAPQRMVDKLFARTTRKKSVWARFKWELAGLAAAACGAFVWAYLPAQQAFNAHDLVAYMNMSADDEYTAFAQELTDMEGYF
ncbi:MAG: zf-HC2 domain-containing protein [Elusimicrobiaceae bacterium]|nr:zf-HC2 domain-containing protein [Elusimicrobiaceae bacterium]